MECDLDFQVGSSRVSSLMDDLRLLREADPRGGEKLARIILRVAEPEDYAAEPERQQGQAQRPRGVSRARGCPVQQAPSGPAPAVDPAFPRRPSPAIRRPRGRIRRRASRGSPLRGHF